MADLPELEGYRLHRSDDQSLEVEVPRALGINPLFRQLERHGIEVVSLRNRHNRLEELFLSLVEERE